MQTIEVTDDDLRALAVLFELAEVCEQEFIDLSQRHNTKPEWFMGLVMKLENLID